jgi:hypothetical protein
VTKRARIPALLIAGLIAALALPTSAVASHNRASQLTWERVAGGDPGDVEFTLTYSARRSYYSSLDVGDTFSDPQVLFGDGQSATPQLTVIAVDEDEDVVYAEGEVRHTYSGAGPYTAVLSGCCRLQGSSGHVNNPDQNFRAQTTVNPTGDVGGPNSSIRPIVDCRPGAVCSFNVVAFDPAGRKLRWRMATSSEATGASSFKQPGPPHASSGASINAATGQYSWDTAGAQVNTNGETFYSTQVIVESLDGAGSVVSSTAVDFLIRLTDEAKDLRPDCSDTDGNGSTDNDQDGLCDDWESSGIDFDHDGSVDLKLYDGNGDGSISAFERADPNTRDIFVEIDYMKGLPPDRAALNGVIRAFAAAPQPIRLHYVVGDEIPFWSSVIFGPCGSGGCPSGAPRFSDLKADYFGNKSERDDSDSEAVLGAKRFAFHYALWINRLAGSGASGIGEAPGNDFVVSLGSWTRVENGQKQTGGTTDEQAGTFMHELGHNLGLRHGGGDDVNCKPNYLSLMSYSRQFAGSYVSRRPLDYSRSALPTLAETALDERAGIGVSGPTSLRVSYGPGFKRESSAAGPLDWNNLGGIDSSSVAANINDVGGSNCESSLFETLVGHDDWAAVDLAFQATTDFAEGVSSTLFTQPPELTYDDLAAVSSDPDGDGLLDFEDSCPRQPNAEQADADRDGTGDACQPTARDDRFDATAGQDLEVPAPGLLGNDTVAGGTPRPDVVETVAGGTARLDAGGGLRYSPRPGFNGTDSFSYALTNEHTLNEPATSSATVTVEVAPARVTPPTDPVGPRDPIDTTFDRALRLSRASVSYSRRRARFVVRFSLNDPARVRVQLTRRIKGKYRGIGLAKSKKGKTGNNSLTFVLRKAKRGRYRAVFSGKAADGRTTRVVRYITIKR